MGLPHGRREPALERRVQLKIDCSDSPADEPRRIPPKESTG
jgi:hypothetical protein